MNTSPYPDPSYTLFTCLTSEKLHYGIVKKGAECIPSRDAPMFPLFLKTVFQSSFRLRKVERFPTYPKLPHIHSLSHYSHFPLERNLYGHIIITQLHLSSLLLLYILVSGQTYDDRFHPYGIIEYFHSPKNPLCPANSSLPPNLHPWQPLTFLTVFSLSRMSYSIAGIIQYSDFFHSVICI